MYQENKSRGDFQTAPARFKCIERENGLRSRDARFNPWKFCWAVGTVLWRTSGPLWRHFGPLTSREAACAWEQCAVILRRVSVRYYLLNIKHQHWSYRYCHQNNLVLADSSGEMAVLDSLNQFKKAGGSTIVENSSQVDLSLSMSSTQLGRRR